ncbi:DUF72 domain-containing protein [Rhodoligotrophos defluvii]|uniref:DUF72 domain-containing protein n=1 Tax=Rhodoligotrophos defluvii TaxID=2561934 RepID=UPI0010C956D6|nr:DUF72 domain-containing protein [Rhodoligotrophos defluvii]
MQAASHPRIRVGIGGWTYEPWRGTFYPADLPQRRELEYASRKLTSIEINGTYYGSQKPESFRKWRDEAPDGFVFSVKGPRFATNRRVLAEAGESIDRFFASGVTELGDKLGPVNWQLPATKRFDAADFDAFLKLLPKEVGGVALRHVVELRHDSFMVPECVDLLRAHDVAVVLTDHATYPNFAESPASFIYARLQQASEDEALGYSSDALDGFAKRAEAWSDRGRRDVFIYMINGFKPKAPAAAMALIERL